MLSSRFLSAAACVAAVYAATPSSHSNSSLLSPGAHLLYQGGNGSWFENVAVRSNGNLLVSRLDIPQLVELNPTTGQMSVVTNFTGVTGALGIAEYAPDVFAVAIGNFSTRDFTVTTGTYSVQTVDLNQQNGQVTPKLLASIPEAGLLNGVAFRAPSTLYVSDSLAFKVWQIDTKTGNVGVAVPENDAFTNNGTGQILTGINGLKWDNATQELYYTNSNKITIGRVPFNGTAFGDPVTIATGYPGTYDFDDFDFDPATGDFYVANGWNGTNFISCDGSSQSFINPANALTLNRPTATIFGRGLGGTTLNTLYITTAGINASGTHIGGQIVAYTYLLQ